MQIRQFLRQNRIALAIATFFLVMQLTNWPPLLFWGWWGGGNFLDSWQVLTSADCYRSIGLQVYELDNKCMIYAYGRPLLLGLSGLHIGASQTSLFGVIFLIVIAITIATIIKNLDINDNQKNVISALVATSPPILLLIDRGNIDSLIVLLVLSAAWSHTKGKSTLAIILLFLSAIFKYYTAPLLLCMIFASKRKRSKTTAAILTVVASLSIFRDLQITEFTFATGNPHLTFGLGHEFLYLLDFNAFAWLVNFTSLAGALLVLFFYGMSFGWLRRRAIELNTSGEKTFTRMLYVFSTIVIMACYLTGANADYRLIFLAISGITLLSIFRISDSFHVFFLHVVCGILWLTFPSGDLEIFGDVFISLYAGFTFALVTKLTLQRNLLALLK